MPRYGGNWTSKEVWKLFFQLSSTVTALMLIAALGKELLKPSPDEKFTLTLVACLFVAAFLAAYGKELGGRIKKIGPVEILEVQKAARELDEDLLDVVRGDHPESLELEKPHRLSQSQKFYFTEGEQLLTHMKLSGSEPEEGAARDAFFELLYKISITAMGQHEWLKAVRWLKHLEKVSKASYRPNEVGNFIAFSQLFAAGQEEGGWRKQRFGETVERLTRLSAKGELDWTGYFWLAYAQDELEQWFEAASSNEEALKRRPRLAPARYNLASSLLKIDRYEEACQHLESIGPQDLQVRQVIQALVEGDEEMLGRVAEIRDSELRQRLVAGLDRLRLLGENQEEAG
jgi:tetratricopeptide (TPR) repeat protein